jgi:hypothetical protein
MDVTLKNDIQPIDTAWVVLFTNNQGRIIGFAISAPHMQPLWTRLFDHTTPPILWRGAINTALLDGSLDVTGWAASDKDKMLYRLGTLKIKELSI